jgi:EamA domain-containing membrane protein RarD
VVPQVALPLQHQELNRGMVGIADKEHGVSRENTLTIHYDISLFMYATKEKNNQLLATPFGFLMGPLMLVEVKAN